MHRRAYFAVVAGFLALSGVVSARAQSSAGREILLNPHNLPGYQRPWGVACDRGGSCMVAWSFGVFAPDGKSLGVKLAATTVSPTGGALAEKILAEDPFDVLMTVAASGRRFALFWSKSLVNVNLPVYQWFDENLEPRSGVIDLPVSGEGERLAIDAQPIPGGFVQLISGYDTQPATEGAFLGFVDLDGHELHPTIRVNESAEGEQRLWFGGLAVDVASGIITVVYEQIRESDRSDIFFRRFSLAGAPLTPSVRANTYLPDWKGYPAVAKGPGGSFVAVWASAEQDGSGQGIFGQRFAKDGAAVGPEFQVNQVTFSDQTRPRIASDAAGNFVVVWASYDPSSFGAYDWDVKARLYRPDGAPAGSEVFVNRHRENYQDIPLVAFAPNGTFMAAWNSLAQVPPENQNTYDIFARRFSASRGDEPCVVGRGKFFCDTGRTGGDPEVLHGFGGASSGFGFLGDVDGDGREDPCVYTGGTFRCDTDHEGGAAEVLIPFSVPGPAVPLLGDVDGDGRADPCLALPGQFACDTRHDGGSAELRIAFGAAGESLLMGDLDGDKRAEACTYSAGLFRCDTGHNGGSAETLIRFGRRGDQPLLGDFDGDGRDDPCVFRKGMLLCDTAHNGGGAEGTLRFGNTRDRVILGNLDGL